MHLESLLQHLHTGGGAVTHEDLNSNTLATYTTGGGNDNISVVGTNGDLTLNTGAENDSIIWELLHNTLLKPTQ